MFSSHLGFFWALAFSTVLRFSRSGFAIFCFESLTLILNSSEIPVFACMGKKFYTEVLGTLFLLFIFNPQYLSSAKRQERTTTTKHLTSSEPPLSSANLHFKIGLNRIILSVSLGILTGLAASVLFACLVRSFLRYLNRTPVLKGPVIFSPKIDPKTLQLALRNENQLLGWSQNGKYYRTVLDNGLTIAVKRLEPFEGGLQEAQSKSGKRRVQHELELLAGLRHRNLMSLRAYVREVDRFSLVYDYVPMGSLDNAMKKVRENQLQLSWEVRLRIAVGVIKGLQYLHFECEPQVLHYNLKPSNVMLSPEFEPRLTDCGLAKLLPSIDRVTSVYAPPKCFHNSRYTDKSDIFSFGMILSVLLTGRDPSDPFFGEATNGGGSFREWLKQLQQAENTREALDKSIMVGEEGEEDEMLMALRIALVCLSDSPADRPSSDELVHILTQLHSF